MAQSGRTNAVGRLPGLHLAGRRSEPAPGSLTPPHASRGARRGIIVTEQTRIWRRTPRVAYASISEMKIVAPPVATFGMSADAACPSDEDMPLCKVSMSSKYPSKMR